MKRYICIWIFIGVVSCCAMDDSDSDYQLTDKRERSSSEEKKQPIRKKALKVERNFAASPKDSECILSNTRYKSLMDVLMWQYVALSFKASRKYVAIEEVWNRQKPDARHEVHSSNGDGLTKLSMQCPGCGIRLQTTKGKTQLFLGMYKHWFQYKLHQPQLYDELKRLIGCSENEARANFEKFGWPKAKIVPFGQQDTSIESSINTDAARQATYERPVPKVVHDLANMHKASLSVDSEEVRLYAQTLMQNDALAKVLGVQEGFLQKALTCPERGCEYMANEQIKQGNEAAAHAALFTQIALHCFQTHKVTMSTHTQAFDVVTPNCEQGFNKKIKLDRAERSNNNFNGYQDDNEYY